MASEANKKRGAKPAKNHVRSTKSTKSGYVVESFNEQTTGGYGNLEGISLTPLQAIRRYCWSCQGGHEYDWRCGDGTVDKKWRPFQEVRDCACHTCFLYPYRTGRRPTTVTTQKPKKTTPTGGRRSWADPD